jgi:hypothetical protein
MTTTTIPVSSSRPTTLAGTSSEVGFITYLTGITSGLIPDGHLWHSIKSSDFSEPWSDFDDVERTAGDAGSIVDAAIRLGNAGPRSFGTHALVVDSSGGLRRTFREWRGDSWAPFEDVKAKASDPGSFLKVSAGRLLGELHVCGLTSDGLLWHTIRHDDGSWESFFDIGSEAGDLGTPVQLACEGYQRGTAADGLQLFVVSSDGRVWSTLRRQSDGHWTPFIEITKPGRAGAPGRFIDIDCYSSTGEREVHVAGVTDDGHVWYAIRREDTSWKKRFTDIELTAGDKGTFISVTAADAGMGNVVGATSDGGLWLTAYDRRSDTFTPFQDVIAEAGAKGVFTSVAMANAFVAG